MLLRLVSEPKIILYLLCSQIGLSLLMPFPARQQRDTGKFLQNRIYEIQVVASRAHMCARAHTHTHTHTHNLPICLMLWNLTETKKKCLFRLES